MGFFVRPLRFPQRGFSLGNVLVELFRAPRNRGRIHEQLPQRYAEHGSEMHQFADAQRPPL